MIGMVQRLVHYLTEYCCEISHMIWRVEFYLGFDDFKLYDLCKEILEHLLLLFPPQYLKLPKWTLNTENECINEWLSESVITAAHTKRGLLPFTSHLACQAPLSLEFSRPNTGVGSRFLLQGILPTQGSNPGFPHCRQILYHLSHQGSPIVKQPYT